MAEKTYYNPNLPFFSKAIFVCFICIFSSTFSNAQLKADFEATPISGCAPMLVNFKDLSTGNPTSWMWDLGNGTISYNKNSSTTYLTPGFYTIKLVVKNDQGADSLVREQLIQVHAPPTVKFSGSPTSGCLPLVTQFLDESTTSTGTIVKWQWDFGDGFNSTEQNPTHTYTDQGNYNVSLRIESSEGCKSSATIPSFIKIDTQIIPKFQAAKVDFCNAPANVTFINSTTGNGNHTYLWDFGDGSTSSDKNPTHTYVSNGAFTVKLSVTNETGCTITSAKADYIVIGAIKASFDIPDIGCKQKDILFKNTSSPTPSKVLWNFGDGTTSTAISPTKKYNASGTYLVQLITFSGDCKDTAQKQIIIQDNAVADFTADKTFSCTSPLTVNFTNHSTNGSSYLWDFGDGNTSTETSPTHTYLTEGNFDVTLIITNASGCADTLKKTNYIWVRQPTVFINIPKNGCAPFTHQFVSAITPSVNIKEYLWEFGDGTTSTEASPTHIYNNPGRYDIKFTFITDEGCRVEQVVPRGIVVGRKPDGAFTADNTDICANTPVKFTDLSTGDVDEWLWNFGDGTTSTEANPVHIYRDTGYFQVKLMVVNNGCPDILTIPKFIHVKGPIANFTSTLNCKNEGEVVFKDQSIIPQTWSWDFGDGSTSTEKNPTHTYAANGSYNVILKVDNATTGCSNSVQRTIKIVKEKADFSVSKDESCKNLPITFTAINSNPSNISLYTWNFGNGVVHTSTSPTYTYNYPIAGSYSVKLKVTDQNGCSDSITKPVAVVIKGPTAFFRAVKSISCVGDYVSFFDSSYSDLTSTVVKWEWTWGDNQKDTLMSGPFSHIYNAPGNYNVTLKVTDSYGCTDTKTKNAEVVIPMVSALFSGDSLSCTTKSVKFKNTSIGNGLNYLWDFGDNTQSTVREPIHNFASEGIYSVSLKVTDENGCSSEITKDSIIKIANPVADFTADITYSYCPPLVTQFTNNSINFLKSTWDFGDATRSTATNPSHFYGSAGNFVATLTVTGAEGCESTKTMDITVKGPSGIFNYDTLQGCLPLLTHFKASTFENKSLIWDFNDGTTISTTDSVISYTYTLPGKYVPKIILVDENDCHVPIQGLDTITVLGVTANFNTNTTLVCTAGEVAFTDSSYANDPIIKYAWKFGDGSTSTAKNPTHLYQNLGKFWPSLIVETREGCKDTIESKIEIDVNLKPIIDIQAPDGVCVPATVSIKGIHQNPDTSTLSWYWNFDNGKNSSLQNPDSVVYSSPRTYTLQAMVESTNGCKDTATKTLEIYPLPPVKINPSANSVCKGSPTVLNTTGAANYTWNSDATLSCSNCSSPIARPDSTQFYYVTGTSDQGCQASDSVQIKVVQPFQITATQSADSICKGATVKLDVSGTDNYTWSPSEGLGTTTGSTVMATPLSTTNYRVIGSDAQNCFKDTAYLPIMVFPIPLVDAGADTSINVGQQLTIMPTISSDVSSVVWSPSAGIISSVYPGIIVRPTETTRYIVEVQNAGGCKSSAQKTVYVLCNNANIFIPNTFSPNKDGVNDIFFPRGTGIFKIKDFKIFNRWGQMVFHRTNFNANDPASGWDGTFKGENVMPDVFVYIMEVVCENNVIMQFKGDITLIR